MKRGNDRKICERNGNVPPVGETASQSDVFQILGNSCVAMVQHSLQRCAANYSNRFWCFVERDSLRNGHKQKQDKDYPLNGIFLVCSLKHNNQERLVTLTI